MTGGEAEEEKRAPSASGDGDPALNDDEKKKKAPGAQAEDIEPGAVLGGPADGADADEAYKVLAAGRDGDGALLTMTPEEERRLLRKIDLHLMPLLCVVYGLNYLDKTTVSYASVMGLKVRKPQQEPKKEETLGL